MLNAQIIKENKRATQLILYYDIVNKLIKSDYNKQQENDIVESQS